MDQEIVRDADARPELLGDDRLLLVDNLIVQVQKFNGNPIGVQFPPHVEMTVSDTEEGVRGNTASGSVTKTARARIWPLDSGAALHQGSARKSACTPTRDLQDGVGRLAGSRLDSIDLAVIYDTIFQCPDLKQDLAALRLEREPDTHTGSRWVGWLLLAVFLLAAGGGGVVVVLARAADRGRNRRGHAAAGGNAGLGAERHGVCHRPPPRDRLVEDHRQGRGGQHRGRDGGSPGTGAGASR